MEIGTFVPDNLLAGGFYVVTEGVTIASGQNLTNGAVLGKVTATGKYTLCDTAATDGSESPSRILLEDTDASAADKVAAVAQTGEFNDLAITLGGATTAADVKAALEALNIYLKSPSN